MHVITISPGYPPEMRQFTRGLAEVGAQVVGLGDQAEQALDADVRRHLAAYFQVHNLWDEAEMVEAARAIAARVPVARVECLWEPGMMVAARMREAIRVPGLTVGESLPFRDKELMKQVLDGRGVRTPRHARVRTKAEAREAARHIGFPAIVKPIWGAGAIDTYRVDSFEDLEKALEATRHVPELSVEEFVEGDEFTFDTICIGGRVVYHNVSWYRPRPLDGKLHEWISPQAIAIRNVDDPLLREGCAMGLQVLDALAFRDGFTHMEWYRKADGEAVFGEIGARPPGANMVDIMNYACDMDLYRGWAEAVCHGRFSQPVTRKYNCAIVFKRAEGQGHIRRVEGLDGIVQRFGPHIAKVELLPVGAPRRNWKQVQVSDGYVIVRHPELQHTLHMADTVGTDLRLYAG